MAAAASVFLEVRQRMQSGLLIIRETQPEHWPVDVSVMQSLIKIQKGEDCKSINLPPEVRLVPSSCRGLQYVPGDGLHVRLLVQADLNTKLVSAPSDSLKSKKGFTFYCQLCGETIMNNRAFFRVLSLPSEDWSDLVEEWCCHPNPFDSSMLHPQKEDCFLGHNYFLVNSGSESTVLRSGLFHSELRGTLSESPSGGFLSDSKTNFRIFCKRCKTLLGERLSSGATKYYFTELHVQPSEDGFNIIPRSLFLQSIVAQCLIQLASTRSTFRFIIQGTDETVYLLVWLLNSDTLLLEFLETPSSHNEFTVFEQPMPSVWRSSEIRNAIKVLYHPCIKSRNKELVDVWGNDIGVCKLTFPSKTCLELVLVLSQSNAFLPPSLRWMNSFQVAFLKM